jgi:hypothetical protein
MTLQIENRKMQIENCQFGLHTRTRRKQSSLLPLLPPVHLLLLLCVIGANGDARADCYIDPISGRRICTSPSAGWQSISFGGQGTLNVLQSPAPSPQSPAHCRISIGDGTTGSGTLIAVDNSVGLVLTCSHLFDSSTEQIIVAFTNGGRFAARLVERDRAHDLAALVIRPPQVEPLAVDDGEPSGALSACGFGSNGQFRCVRGNVVGHATAAGATHPSLTMNGAVRPGDSGGGVLNAAGQLVGVVWGQRDGLTYATCGRPLREFLGRVRQRCDKNGGGDAPARSPSVDWPAWSREMEARLRALDEKKQDKGHYLQAGDLNSYLRIEDAPHIDTGNLAQRSEVESRLKLLTSRFESIHSRIESVRQHAEEIAASKAGFFQGLSMGKLLVGALGLSGPVAVAVIMAGGLAGRRLKRAPLRVAANVSRDAEVAVAERAYNPIVVDSPIPPQRTVPETHYVPIEKDSFAKAHQWASEHVARKYPGASEILQALESLIKQYLAGR